MVRNNPRYQYALEGNWLESSSAKKDSVLLPDKKLSSNVLLQKRRPKVSWPTLGKC